MTNNPTPVLLDRLARALSLQGVKLTRQQLLETAAHAFGCRNSGEFSAAAKAGDINPPPVIPLGRVALPNGETVLIVSDPLADSPYGIDESFVDAPVEDIRAERIGITPYGHLVRLDDLAAADVPNLAAPDVASLACAISSATEALGGYTAHESESDLVGQAENALSRALEDASSPSAALRHLTTAREILSRVVGIDPSCAWLEEAKALIDGAVRTTVHRPMDATCVQQDGLTGDALRTALVAALIEIDAEIENRQHGGDPLAWKSIKATSDLGHAALAGWSPPASEDPADSIRVSRDALVQAVEAARSHVEDVESGVEDGTYDAEENVGIADTAQAVRDLELRLAMPIPDVGRDETPSSNSIHVHHAAVTHKHGVEILVALSRTELDRKIADYCRSSWNDVSDHPRIPCDPAGMTDAEISSCYFDAMSENEGGEWLDTTVFELPMPHWPESSPIGAQGSLVPVGDDAAKDARRDPSDWADQIAQALEDGISADIWFDAHDHGTDDPADPDRIAEATIHETQLAMGEAARLLRELKPTRLRDGSLMVDGIIPSKERIAHNAKALSSSELIYITDQDGEATANVSISTIASLGLPYHHDRSDSLPLTERELEFLGAGDRLNTHLSAPVQCGPSVLWRNRKWLAPEMLFEFPDQGDDSDDSASARRRMDAHASSIAEMVEALGGSLHAFDDDGTGTNAHALVVLLPFEVAFEAASPDDWNAALSYLLMSEAEKLSRNQVTCEFTAQIDLGRTVVSADPLGDTVWDGTFDALRWGTQNAVDVLRMNADPDDYARSPIAPEWVRTWASIHPFEVDPIGLADALTIIL